MYVLAHSGEGELGELPENVHTDHGLCGIASNQIEA